jgi:hypothetical protein
VAQLPTLGWLTFQSRSIDSRQHDTNDRMAARRRDTANRRRARSSSPLRSPSPAPPQSPAAPSQATAGGVRHFLRDQRCSQLSGAGHAVGAPPFTPPQRALMAASSLLYLCCAATWQHYGHSWLGGCFCLVSILSVGADAGGGVLPESVMLPLRMADRIVGTVGLLSSVACNSNSPTNFLFSLLAVLSSLCFLTKGRAVAKAEPTARWTYLVYHGSWHAYGAAVLAAVTWRAQSSQ